MAKVAKSTDSSSLAEVVDRILDKGIVIDAWVKVSLVGIELLSVEARVVIASVETLLDVGRTPGSPPRRWGAGLDLLPKNPPPRAEPRHKGLLRLGNPRT